MSRTQPRRRLPVRVYVLANLALMVVSLITVELRYPDITKERLCPGPGAKDGLRATLAIVLPTWLSHFIVAALDIKRFHWSDTVPFRLQVAGLMGYIASLCIITWARAENPFFSSVARIQRDRGHRLITGGPYQYVRHPAYTASLLMAPCSSLALGSWLSAVPLLTWFAFVLRRTVIEDAVLREELEGYAQYAEKVRYRLIPGIW